MRKCVQYGCGPSGVVNWRNFDASPHCFIGHIPIIGPLYRSTGMKFSQNVEYGDIVKGLPIQDLTCDVVYCSHILEHLALQDFRRAIMNTHKILKSGGVFRLVLPDLEFSINKYVNDSSTDAAVVFMQDTLLGKEHRGRGLNSFLHEWLGNSSHLWMWDFKSLKHELECAEFMDVRRAEYHDSTEDVFLDVEDEMRWKGCLGIECVKK